MNIDFEPDAGVATATIDFEPVSGSSIDFEADDAPISGGISGSVTPQADVPEVAPFEPTQADADFQTRLDARPREESFPEWAMRPELPVVPRMSGSEAGKWARLADVSGVMSLLPKEMSDRVAGIGENVVADTANFFTSPMGVATMGLGALPKAAQTAIGTVFGAHALKESPETIYRIREAKTPEERDKAIVGAIENALVLGGSGAHLLGRARAAGKAVESAGKVADEVESAGLPATAEAVKASPEVAEVVESVKNGEVPPQPKPEEPATPVSEPPTVTTVPLDPEVVSVPEGASAYKVKSGRATGTVEEYPDRILLKDLVSLDERKGDGGAVIKALQSRGKPIELTAGQRSGDTPIATLRAFYEKRGFEPIEGRPGSFRWEPAEEPISATPVETSAASGDVGRPPEPSAIPTLRPVEIRGDILATQREDLTLIGEKGVETVAAARRAAREAREKAKWAAKQAREQLDLLEEYHGAMKERTYELLDAVQEIGGLPATSTKAGRDYTGELNRIKESAPGAHLRLFRKSAPDLDTIREALNERGFNFETYDDMLVALENRIVSGKKLYGVTDPAYSGGPGAMGPVELAEMESGMSARATSTKNAVMEAERIARGEEPVIKQARLSNQSLLDEAENILEERPEYGQSVVERLRIGGSVRDISAVDEAVLLVEKVKLRNERDSLAERSTEAKTPDEQAFYRQRWNDLEAQINKLDEATEASGSEWGRLGQFRQRLLRDDFTFEAMERRARMEKGEPLTMEESAKIKEQSARIEALEKELEPLRKAAEEKARQETLDKAVEDLKAEAKAEVEPHVASLAERIVVALEREADAARARIRERLGRASAGIDPTVLADVAIIGAAKLGRGSLTFAKWSAEMISDLGEWVKPHLDQVWNDSQARLDDRIEKLAGRNAEKAKKVVKKTDATDGVTRTTERIKARLDDGDPIGQLSPFIRTLAKHFVKQGISERNALVDAVHGVIKDLAPEFTRRQTMDAISGYGDFKPLSTDAASVTLRDLKGQMQQVAKIEDMLAKKAPSKTGVERRTPSDEERRLIKEVNELKKRGGFEVTDPAAQLKSSMDAIKTRLRNEIADLDYSIANKKPLPPKKGSPPYDTEAEALKARRDAKKAQYDSIFPKAPITVAEQLAAAGKVIDRSIADLEADLKAGKLYKDAAKPKPTSPELEAKRARLKALRLERDHLRDLDTARVEADKEASLEKSIKEASAPIEEAPGKPATVDTKRVSELKEQLAALQAARRSSNEMALRGFKSRAAHQIADLRDRMARKDFGRRPERAPIEMDKEALDLEADLADTKQQYLKDRHDYQQAMRSRGKKILDGIRAGRGVTVNLASSMDFSAPRQAFIAIVGNVGRLATNPIRGARMLANPFPDMFKAWASEKAAKRIDIEIKNRPNAKSGADKLAGIEFSELATNTFTKFEENARSVLDEWAEIPMNTGNLLKDVPMAPVKVISRGVRMSNRAFITFLNSTRATLFDELLRANFKDRPPTLTEMKVLGNYVNISTGRGKMNPMSSKVSAEVMWAPKLLASRIQFLAGQPIWGAAEMRGSGRARAIVAKEYARAIAGGFILWNVSRLFDEKKEEHSTSSDFGKIVRGNTRVDIWGGLQQVAVLASRGYKAESTTLKGDVKDLGENRKFGTDGMFVVSMKFLRSKARPDVAVIIDALDRRNFVGEAITPAQVAENLVVPLPLRDLVPLLEAHGLPEGLALIALGQFGAGVSIYDEDFKIKERPR